MVNPLPANKCPICDEQPVEFDVTDGKLIILSCGNSMSAKGVTTKLAI